ncbi:lipoprotein [Streptomyces chlorus]|uniref:Lipoprotein n=1 Tax=Streptomyces chlorus TaxID=887452 RepID=A0ABW1DRV0_9ACTN
MRTTAVRRSALAASAAALALLITACGGSGDSESDSGKSDEGKAGSSASAAPAAKALTAAELEKVALVQADMKDGKVVTKVPATDDLSADKVKADDEACQPLANLQLAVPVGSPAATVKRSWTGEPKKPAEGTAPEEALLAGLAVDKVFVTLASYEDGGAEQVVKDVDAAVEKCAGGFTVTAAGEKIKFLKAAKAEGPKGADEAVEITLTMAAEEGVEAPVKVVVTRTGATVVGFSAVNFGAIATGEEAPFPTQISDAQLAKLG